MTRAPRTLLGVLAALLLLAAPAQASVDPWYANQWGLDLRALDAAHAWGLSTGAGVSVAVVDTGVDPDQEDLVGHLLGGWGFDGTTEDSSGHGTEVAGLIAATKDNNKGIAGVAPDAKIVPIRVFDSSDDTPSVSRIVQALDMAAASGARVVNASFSTPTLAPGAPSTIATQQAIDGVLNRHPGTLFVAAAGNDGRDNDAAPVYPCASAAANLLCVGSYERVRNADTLDPHSNYGATTVDLFAPGVSIAVPASGSPSSYHYDSGTSMAAPFVSGEAALLFAEVPLLTPQAAIHLIMSKATPVPAFFGKSVSGGEADAYAALQAATVDSDGDGVVDALDACPGDPETTGTGCKPPPVATVQPTPTPTPTATPTPVPQLRTLTAKVSRCKAGRSCKRSASVHATPDRAARLSVRVDRQICSRKRCRWSSVLKRALTAGTRGVTVTVRGNRRTGLPKGSYRVIAVPSSAAGTGRSLTRKFRVR